VEGLVEGDAEREFVGAGVGGAAEVLLGGHVQRGAHDRAGGGEALEQLARAVQFAAVLGDMFDRVGDAGQTEVHHADPARAVDEHVLGLEVAVDEADLVGGLQPAPGLQEGRQDAPPVALLGGEPGLEGGALDELEREEHLALVGAGLEDLQHVGVGDLRHRLGLAQQAAVADGLAAGRGEVAVQQLDRDLAVEVHVVGGIDHAHAAGAERLEHLVAADLGRHRRLAAATGAQIRGAQGRLAEAHAVDVFARHTR
jgi:hypothetical protein